MNPLRVGVVGCGHLGSIHARLLKSHNDVELAGVVDPLPAARNRVAEECDCAAFAKHQGLMERIDAAVIATPTQYHHVVALDMLLQGVHLLIEKPITNTVGQANELIAAARRNDLVLQVGHVERFNPAWNAVAPELESPQFIEAVRSGNYTFRSTDVSIVLDLMIHDLDLVLSLVQSPVVSVEAMGLALFGPHEDWATARLRFANGCVANLKSSRINPQPQRSMQIFAREASAEIDFAQGQAQMIRPTADVLAKRVDLTTCPPEQRDEVKEAFFEELMCLETVAVDRVNAILQEQEEFVGSIRTGQAVRVTGEHGRDALAVAEKILDSIQQHRWNGLDEIGPHARFLPPTMPARRAA